MTIASMRVPTAGSPADPRLEALSQLAPAEVQAFTRAVTLARILSEERVLAVMPEIVIAR